MRSPVCVKALLSGGAKAGFAVAALGMLFATCVAGFSLEARASVIRALGSTARSDFVVAGKRAALGDSRGSGNSFSEEDLRAIAALPGVENVYPVVSNACRAEVSVRFGSFGYRSEMFFESVPDTFLGELPEGWDEEGFVPIVVSKEFVALYNVGFAPSRGLPSLGEGVLAGVPLELTVWGRNGSATMPARVVGTTDRFPSFLVPERVMRWMNEDISGEPGIVRRVVVASSDSGDPALARGLAARGLEVTSGNAVLSETASLATTVLGSVAAAGAFVGLLAATMVLLALQLMLARRSVELSLLVDLGWSPARLCRMFAVRAFALAGVASLAGWIVSSQASGAFDALLAGTAVTGLPTGAGRASAIVSTSTAVSVGVLSYFVTRRELSRSKRLHAGKKVIQRRGLHTRNGK